MNSPAVISPCTLSTEPRTMMSITCRSETKSPVPQKMASTLHNRIQRLV